MPHIVGKSIAVPSSECLLELNHSICSIVMWNGQGNASRPQKQCRVRSTPRAMWSVLDPGRCYVSSLSATDNFQEETLAVVTSTSRRRKSVARMAMW